MGGECFAILFRGTDLKWSRIFPDRVSSDFEETKREEERGGSYGSIKWETNSSQQVQNERRQTIPFVDTLVQTLRFVLIVWQFGVGVVKMGGLCGPRRQDLLDLILGKKLDIHKMYIFSRPW